MFPKSLKVFKPEGGNESDLKAYIEEVIKIVSAQKNTFDIFKDDLKVKEGKELHQWPVVAGVPYKSLIAPEDMGVTKGRDDRHLDWATSPKGKDSNKSKPVFLVLAQNSNEIRGRHWSIQWRMQDIVDDYTDKDTKLKMCKAVALAYVAAIYENPRLKKEGKILANWGPIVLDQDSNYDKVHIGLLLGEMTLAQRTELLEIVWNTPPMKPNNDYNCQNWVLDVLGIAVARGKCGLNEGKVKQVIEQAMTLKPESKCGTVDMLGLG